MITINRYLAIVICLLSVAFPVVLGQPTIVKQPTDQSVSLGATVTNLVTVAGSGPFAYQWRFNALELLTATNRILVRTNVLKTEAGSYAAVITDFNGSVTSRVATLNIDATFTKITTGRIVTDRGDFQSCAWADFDNDGFQDLFVVNNGTSALYRNTGEGTFARITNGVAAKIVGNSSAAVWGDYDNDGWIDLFLANFGGQNNALYRNQGDGTFTRITSGKIVSDGGDSSACSWGDFDNDGFLDLFVSNLQQSNFLYHNTGDGTNFIKITSGTIVTGASRPFGCPWGDYNNDGFLDLAVASAPKNLLYNNNGNGTFTKVVADSLATDPISGGDGAAWGDYDNDGDLDLFVTDNSGGGNRLYRNNGDGSFTKITNTVVTLDKKVSAACSWGDYDNDGYLDLFVANGIGANENNFLFHNDGDGQFTKILTGSLVNDGGASLGCAWADYDNDGFIDLFVANQNSASNFLYRNSANSNNWIKFRLVGTVSNRSAVGAKVRVRAIIGGRNFWQLREISTGDGFDGNSLIAHFGLGDATNVDTVRIEWPSGAMQEFYGIPSKQTLILVEPPKLQVRNDEFRVRGGRSFQYSVELSSNLIDWRPLTSVTITNVNGIATFKDPDAPSVSQRFYRAVSP